MSDLKPMNADKLEIVGFNGAPLVECGRSLPVVRRSSDRMYCVLDLARGGAALSWHNQDEANTFAQAGRWTRLREPLPVPRSCISEPDGGLSRQPMLVYAKQPFLDAAGQVAWPARFHDEDFYWRHIEHSEESTEAGCASSVAVEALLDDWATLLKRRFDALHQQGHDRASLKRMADFMLCSAKTRSLRWQAYLRFAMVQEPERVRQTFDALVRHEFPNMDWQCYLDQIKSLGNVLRSVPVPMSQPAKASSSLNTKSKLNGIAAIPPINPYHQIAA